MRLALLSILAVSPFAAAADWPQFRGPGGAAVSPEVGLPSGFTADSGLRWKAKLPGRGLSSPVIVGGRVYITCSSGPKDDRLHVLSFDAGTGTELWHRQLAATGLTYCHPKTCMAAPTPVADETGVYALYATGDLVCVNLDGTVRWYRSLVGDYPTLSNQVGMASSLILHKDKLIVPMDNAGESFVAALDTKTGKNAWKVTRPRDVNWMTPILKPNGKSTEVIFPTSGDLVAYDIDTGKKIWSEKIPSNGIPSPTLGDDGYMLIGSRGVTAVSLNGDKPKQLWNSPKLAIGMTSPLIYKGLVYAANPSGIVACANAQTGEVYWQERVKGPFSASPVAADGKLYVLNEAGVLTTIKLGDKPEVIAESKTEEEGLATPAISGGAIFLRGQKTLFCVGSKLGG